MTRKRIILADVPDHVTDADTIDVDDLQSEVDAWAISTDPIGTRTFPETQKRRARLANALDAARKRKDQRLPHRIAADATRTQSLSVENVDIDMGGEVIVVDIHPTTHVELHRGPVVYKDGTTAALSFGPNTDSKAQARSETCAHLVALGPGIRGVVTCTLPKDHEGEHWSPLQRRSEQQVTLLHDPDGIGG